MSKKTPTPKAMKPAPLVVAAAPIAEPAQPRHKFERDLEWLFEHCESECGVRSNFQSLIDACKLGSFRPHLEDGELVHGVNEVQSDLYNEDAQIDAIDTRRARSRGAAASQNRKVYAVWILVPPRHQEVLEAAYLPRQYDAPVRVFFGELAGLAHLTPTARSMVFTTAWSAGAIGRQDPQVLRIRAEARVMFDDALRAFGRAHEVNKQAERRKVTL